MKRAWVVGVGLALALSAGAAWAFYIAGQKGSSPIERWMGARLQSLASAYLNPHLSFEDLDYQYPGTITLKNLRVTENDIDILGAAEATLELAETPSIGSPLKIDQILLRKPLFQAVSVSAGSKQFVGFSNLLRENGASTKETSLLSDVLQVRRIELDEGRIIYDAKMAGAPAMVIDQINTVLDIVPARGGVYQVKTKIAKPSVFELTVCGNLNLDHFSADGIALELKANVGREQDSYLPPQLQKFFSDHEVRGALSVKVAGAASLRELSLATLSADVRLDDANFAAGEYRWPIKRMELAAKMAGGQVILDGLQILGADRGAITLTGSVLANDRFDADLRLAVSNVFLQDAVRAGGGQKLAGRLNGEIVMAAPLKTIIAKASAAADASRLTMPPSWGWGRFDLDEGELVRIPLVGGFQLASGKQKKSTKPTDQAKLVFALGGDEVRLSEITYASSVLAARGYGSVGLDQSVHLFMNGGPLEKVQWMLSKDSSGGSFGKFTDSLTTYRIVGTLSEPTINVAVGGETASSVKEKSTKTGEGFAQQVIKLGDKLRGRE